MDRKRILFTNETEFSTTEATDSAPATVTGYAMKWNTLSSDRGGYFVRLLPNSGTPAPTTFALVNHDYNNLLARSDDGSLRMSADDIGLKVEIDMPNTQLGRDTYELIRTGKIRGMSFAMIPGGTSSMSTENGKQIMSFSQFQFDEVTATPIPAFGDTSIEVKPNNATSTDTLQLMKEIVAEQYKIEKYKLDSYSSFGAEYHQIRKGSHIR